MAFVESVSSFLRRNNNDIPRLASKDVVTTPAPDIRLIARTREFSRTTGYHNAFTPEAADIEAGQRGATPLNRPSTYQRTQPRSRVNASCFSNEVLPEYTSTVNIEGRVELKLESVTPFNTVENGQWHDVYLVLRGTMLAVHTYKTTSSSRTSLAASKILGSHRERGGLIRTYTMQHAELGVASDHPKVILVPKPLVQLLPEASLDYLRATEPHLFDAQRQYVVRLRVEGHQMVFRFNSAEEREAWVEALCQSVDIAAPLDERDEPRYQTLPRRRRAHRLRVEASGSLEDQQEICRRHLPRLSNSDERVHQNAGLFVAPLALSNNERLLPRTEPQSHDSDVLIGEITLHANATQRTDVDTQEPAVVPQELDTSFTLPDFEMVFERRLNYLNNLFHHVNCFFDQPTNSAQMQSSAAHGSVETSRDQKWDPKLSVDPMREARYRRRCMPSLLYNSRYANNFVIRDGIRLEINWDERQLQLPNTDPPPYQEIQIEDKSPSRIEAPHLLQYSRCHLRDVDEQKLGPVIRSMPAHLRSTTLPVPLRIEGLDDPSEQPSDDQSAAPLLSVWKELKEWTQSVRAASIREDIRPTMPVKRLTGLSQKAFDRSSISEHALRRLGM